MPKAYWIAHVTVTEATQYKLYADGAPAAFEKYNAKILARGGSFEQLEGKGHSRNVVIEFNSMADALACYHSEEYQSAKQHRREAGIAEIVIVEGV
ncbi:MAG: DUF1330 domain-containing protein [Sneathiella sp.]|nr:DUF1330 domain-containing protein [Sneathiella sp.]